MHVWVPCWDVYLFGVKKNKVRAQKNDATLPVFVVRFYWYDI